MAPQGLTGDGVEPTAADHARWRAAQDWSDADRMNELETTMWRSERHPRRSSTIASLMILDTAPDWDRLVAAHEWAASLVLRARQRVIEPLLPTGPPAWVLDRHFTAAYHVRRQQLGARNSMADLLELVQTLLITPFDRTRPLWEATLIEGLDGERAAYLLKLHHSLTDGLGAVQLLTGLQSRTREHVADKSVAPPEQVQAHPPLDPWGVAAEGLRDQVRVLPRVAGGLLAAGVATVRDPLAAAGTGLRVFASARRVLTPPAQRSPVLQKRDGRHWLLRTLECPLADLRAAGRAAGGSVNDAYVAALLGGLRRYHEHFGVHVDEVPVTLPVSLRRQDDPLGGNSFAGAVIPAPVGVADPADRILAVRGAVLTELNEPALDTFSVIPPIVNRLPSRVGTTMMDIGAHADLAASNVPGITEEVFLAGARVERVYPFGPLPGVAVMAVLGSHQGTCCIGLTIDAAAVPDADLLARCFQEGFDEVLALRGTTRKEKGR